MASAMSLGTARRAASPGLAWLFGPLAILFVAFLALPLIALFYRAIGGGELSENLTSDLVLDALRLSVITSTFTLSVARRGS